MRLPVHIAATLTTDDHVYPMIALWRLIESGSPLPSQSVLIIVPSCRECNMVANDKVFNTFQGKRGHIKESIYKRYRKQLESPEWYEDEIEELGDGLRDFIKVSEVKRDIILERLSY